MSEFAENCREVMLDLYEEIVKVWEEGTFMLSCKEETKADMPERWKRKKTVATATIFGTLWWHCIV